jgi:hypothetical protein
MLLTDLPFDILCTIIDFCDLFDLVSLRSINSDLKDVIDSSYYSNLIECINEIDKKKKPKTLDNIFIILCKKGNLNVIIKIIKYITSSKIINIGIIQAVKYNHVDILKYLKELIPQNVLQKIPNFSCSKKINIIKKSIRSILDNKFNLYVNSYGNYLIMLASNKGNVNILQEFRKNWNLSYNDICESNNTSLILAIKNNDIKLLRELKEWGITIIDIKKILNKVIHFITAEILKEFREWKMKRNDILINNSAIIRIASKTGNIDILKELREHWKIKAKNVRVNHNEALILASINGHIAIFHEFKKWGLNKNDISNNVLSELIENNHINILQELRNTWDIKYVNVGKYTLKKLANKGYIDMLKELQENWNICINNVKIFKGVNIYNINTLKYLIEYCNITRNDFVDILCDDDNIQLYLKKFMNIL